MTDPAFSPVRHTEPIAIGWRQFLPSWPVLVALALFGKLLLAPDAMMHDPDTYMHIAAGRWMLAHHALPFHDPFSYTKPGAPWVPHEWLAEIVIAGIYRIAGWSGLALMTAGCAALGLGLLTRLLLRWAEPFTVLITVVLAAALTFGHVLARPHILTYPLIVLWAGSLFAVRESGKRPPFKLLPLMVLWANLHGGFMFGIALAGFLAVEAVLFPADGSTRAAEARRWGLFVLLAAGAGFLTPNGLAGFLQPFRLIDMPALKSTIEEWQSPNFQNAHTLEIWLLTIIGLGFGTGFKLPPMRLVFILGLCHMTLQSARFAELLALVGPLAVMPSLGPKFAAAIRAPGAKLSRAMSSLNPPAGAASGVLALFVAAGMSLPLSLHPLVRKEGPATPAKALAAARRMGLLSGRVFNAYGFGGYLIYKGVPTFIDGRAEMYGNDFLAHYVKAYQGDAKMLRALLGRYRVTWTLLTPGSGAEMRLDSLKGWRRVYADKDAVIHVRIAALQPPPPR